MVFIPADSVQRYGPNVEETRIAGVAASVYRTPRLNFS